MGFEFNTPRVGEEITTDTLDLDVRNALLEEVSTARPGQSQRTADLIPIPVTGAHSFVLGTLTIEDLRASEARNSLQSTAADKSPERMPLAVEEHHDHSEKRGRSVARVAERVAADVNTVGWCFRAVATTLERFGITLSGKSAFMAADQLGRHPKVQEVSVNELRPGDILVHGKSQAHKHGHIAVYIGNGLEASDHVQKLISGRGYGGTRVFRITG